MRKGELFSLKWSDVDLRNRLIHVRDSKSNKQRTLPMDDTLRTLLKSLPSRFKGDYVFPSKKTGRKLHDAKKSFATARAKAGIPDLRFHDLRHTFASHLVMCGVDLTTVAELLGHSTTKMTERYSHLSQDHKTRAVKVLDSAYQTDTKTDTIEKTEHPASA